MTDTAAARTAVEVQLHAACDCDCGGGGGTWRDNVSDLASFVKYILMWREIESRRSARTVIHGGASSLDAMPGRKEANGQ